MLSKILEKPCPESIDEKKAFLLSERIAVWDVIAKCDINGSSDSSIKNAEPNDISKILGKCRINAVFTNGKTASALYEKYIFPSVMIKSITLPSTSPANAAWNIDRLCEKWKIIKNYLID